MPAALEGLFQSGVIALVAIAIILAELVVFGLRRRQRFAAFAANGLSGVCLLAALYVGLTDGPIALIALALSLAFVAHLANVVLDR